MRDDNPADKWALEALASTPFGGLPPADGTYELIGPKINGNPENVVGPHILHRHGSHPLNEIHDVRKFAEIRAWLDHRAIEGIVWHHRDGRMAKIKRKDFGFQWPLPAPR